MREFKLLAVVAVITIGVFGLGIAYRVNDSKQQKSEVVPMKNNQIQENDYKAPKPATDSATTQDAKKNYTQPPVMLLAAGKSYRADLKTTKGSIKVNLFSAETPKTVNNFVFLAREGFYDRTQFHRIMKDFMIQGGDPEGTGRGGPGYRFDDEPVTKDYTRGTLAMANSGPNTNGSQFFIMHADNQLPKQYVIFGAIDPGDTASLSTLDAIASSPVIDNGTGEPSKPVSPVMLETVEISEQ